MTLEEQANITLGVSATANCSGFTGSVPRLNFPGICLSDASSGLRGIPGVSGYTSGISIGSSFNRELAKDRASALGKEFKAKGVNVLLGPVVGCVWLGP